jgi:DNA replication and repair protein RecF
MHTLLEGDPTLRRRFVDWNVFHVEPQFGALRQRFRRVAAQRNAWLKAGGTGRPVWDREYSAVLGQVAEFRQRFFAALAPAFIELATDFSTVSGVTLEWRSGLAKGLDIEVWLREHLPADIARGILICPQLGRISSL